MARIRKYEAQRPMEVIPAGAKAQPEAMSQEAGAMAGFGGTVMSVAQKWQDERDNAEISRLQSAINNFQYTALRQLEDDWRAGKFTNADQFKQVEDDYIKARDKMVNSLVKGKRGRISDRVSEYAEQNKASDTANFYRNLFPKEKEFMSVEGLKIVEGYKLQGDRDKALMAIEQYKHWFGLGKAETLKANLDADMAVLQHQNFLEQVAVDTREMPIADALSAINQISRTAITETERNGLIAQRKRQEEIATATTNRQVRWDTLLKIAKDPESVTDAYLEALVKPNSLTWDDVEELRKIRDTDNHPLKRADARRAFTTLEEIKDMRITMLKQAEGTEEELREELLLQFGLKNDFEKWLLEKDRTTEEIEGKVKSLTEPDVEEIALNWLERLMWTKRTQLFGLVGTQEERLAKKKAKAGIKEKLTPEIARQYLNLAGGDRKRAEELARDAGYEW